MLSIANQDHSRNDPGKEAEDHVLLEIGYELLQVRDKKDLTSTVNRKLKSQVHFDQLAVIRISDDGQYYAPLLTDCSSASQEIEEEEQIVTTWYANEPVIIKQVFTSTLPVVFDLDQLDSSNHLPLYLKAAYEQGNKDALFIRLTTTQNANALIILLSKTKGKFNLPDITFLSRLSGSFSICIANLIAHDELQRRDRERETLLMLSQKISRIRDKDGLLALLNKKLKKLIHYNHSNIVAISEDGQTFSAFVTDPKSASQHHADYPALLINRFSTDDTLFKHVLGQDEPFIFSLTRAAKQGCLPSYLNPAFESGLKEAVAICLRIDDRDFGVLSFFSDREHGFHADHLNVIKGVASQVSTAVANILANEAIRVRKEEKEALLFISGQIAKINDKQELLLLINTELRKLFYFTHSSISALTEDKKSFYIYLTDPHSKSKGHEAYTELISAHYPVCDGVFETFLSSDDPTISDYEEVMKNEPPPYARIHYEAGLREAVSIPLRGENEIWGVLHFYSDKKRTFNPDNVSIIRGVANQVAIAVSNIIANEDIQARQKEKETLLRISYEIGRIRDKMELLTFINTSLKVLFEFSYSSISVISEDRNTFVQYLVDPQSVSRHHPDYIELITTHFKVNDGVFINFIRTDEPYLIKHEQLMKMPNPPRYVTIHYEAGFRETLSIPLYGKDRNHIWGVLHFYATTENTFTSNYLTIIKGVASQVAIAVSNIVANEQIQLREKEKETLLTISYQMAKIRNKEELLHLLNIELLRLFYFTHASISAVSKDLQYFTIYLTDPKTRSKGHHNFNKMMDSRFAVSDGFFEKFLQSDEPSVHVYQDIIQSGKAPLYAQIHYEVGLREVISIVLHNEEKIWGVLHFYSDRLNTFSANERNIIRGVASQVAIAISNIEANEEIQRREMEKANLLSVSFGLGKIRDKNSLLAFLNKEFKRLFYFTTSTILEISEDKKTFAVYLTDPHSISSLHPQYLHLITSRYPTEDGIFNRLLETDDAMVINYEFLQQQPNPPAYVPIQYEAGHKEGVVIPLHGDKGIWGVLFFASDQAGTFTTNSINILRGVASQVAIAVSNIRANEQIHVREQEKEMLLTLSHEMGKVQDKNDLLNVINTKLKKLFYFTHTSIAAINEDRETFTVFLTDPGSYSKDHPDFIKMITTRYPIKDGLFEEFLLSDEPTISDIEKNAKKPGAPRYTIIHFEAGLREAVSIPLIGENGITFGIITFYADRKNNFTKNNLTLIKGAASQIGIAVSNILAHDQVREREREKTLLLSFSHDISTVRDKKGLSMMINQYLKNLFLVREYVITTPNEDRQSHSYYLFDLNEPFTSEPAFAKVSTAKIPTGGGITGAVLAASDPLIFELEEVLQNGMMPADSARFWRALRFERILGIPLNAGNESVGILWTHPDQINDRLLKGISAQIAIAMANIIANEKIEKQLGEINRYKQQLEQENLYLQQEIDIAYNYSEMVGSGDAMQKVYRLLSQVSFANSSVLILGETGTGKELIARAIHNTSPRKDKLMVKVNCAALPTHLIESELFGHEKGSFTGATERRIGKFELANNSTLFLDEIGEMPWELQVKLLRALQEKEIERVGGQSTIKVNVRIIAATNRNLQKEVEEGRFRSDLYFRLNVFPITLPPLRERKEDLPSLIQHFMGRYSKNAGKKIQHISSKVLKEIQEYDWPGNIRELEHLIERSVLLTAGNTIKEIHLPSRDAIVNHETGRESVIKTIDEIEREHILHVLSRCRGKVQGPGGAAEILQLPPTTLHSKMKRLGISKNYMP